MAGRNLLASPINLLIGGLLLLGTMVFVLLGGLLDSLNQSMQRSVVGSLAGHLQIYSAKSKDDLALFGQMGNDPDLKAITDFTKLEAALSSVENVKEVVPMGVSGALITSGNIIDTTLASLRNLSNARAGRPSAPGLDQLPKEELDRRVASETAHLRQIIKVLRGDAEKAAADMLSAKSADPYNLEALRRVEQDAFWESFDADPFGNLEFLENRIAPIVTDTSLVFLRYVGTDLDKFQRSFDRMKMIKGTPVPSGQRGFLIADLIHEDQMKLKTARRLDKLKDARANGRLIADDDELKRFVKREPGPDPGAGAAARRPQDREAGRGAAGRAGLDGAERRRAALPVAGHHRRELRSALRPVLRAGGAAGAALPGEGGRHAHHQGVHQVGLHSERQREGVRHLRLHGPREVAAGGRHQPDGPDELPRAVRLPDRDKAEELKEIQRATGAKSVSRENAEDELFGEGSGWWPKRRPE